MLMAESSQPPQEVRIIITRARKLKPRQVTELRWGSEAKQGPERVS